MPSTLQKLSSLFILLLLTSSPVSLIAETTKIVNKISDPSIKCDTCPCDTCQLTPPPLPPPSPPPPPPPPEPAPCPPPPPPPSPPLPPPPAPKETPCNPCSTPAVSSPPPPPRLVYATNNPGNVYVINQNDPGLYSGQERIPVAGLPALVFGWAFFQILVWL